MKNICFFGLSIELENFLKELYNTKIFFSEDDFNYDAYLFDISFATNITYNKLKKLGLRTNKIIILAIYDKTKFKEFENYCYLNNINYNNFIKIKNNNKKELKETLLKNIDI